MVPVMARSGTMHGAGAWCPLVCLLLLLLGCGTETNTSSAPSTPSAQLAHVDTNEKHGIAVEFYGNFMGPDDNPRAQLFVDRVSVAHLRSDRRVDFVPKDMASLQSSFGLYQRVWSPDEEFLVLPEGRFDGFVVFAATDAVDAIKSERPQFGFAMQAAKTSAALWHEFVGWRRPHTLQFRAGLGDRTVEFELDLLTRSISTASPHHAGFLARTNGGKYLTITGPQ